MTSTRSFPPSIVPPRRTRTTRRADGLLAALVLAALLAACSGWGSDPEATEASPAQTPFAKVAVPELFLDPEAEPDEGRAPLSVAFKANVEDNLGPNVECEWDFDDGSPKAKGTEANHVFAAKKDYEVRVSCKDSEGIRGESEVDVFVE
jgi:hypothetical protein